ncbi:MAG TPA: S8/S53 family peptidase [Mycobacteriales bacterium]
MSTEPESRAAAAESLQDVLTVRRHTADFGRTWTDREWRREVLGRARSGRGLKPELPQIDILIRPEDDYLVGTGELLIRADEYDERAQRLVTSAGFVAEPMECLRGRVLQLRRQGATAEELAEASEALRHRGVPVSFNFVPPMAVVMKSQGGPEPAARRWPPHVPVADPGPVRVAIVDTGVADQRRTDGWLEGLAGPGSIDALFSDPTATDPLLDAAGGHGTSVAGLVQHEAPAATLAMYAAVPPDGSALESEIACAMVTAVQDGFDAGQSVVLNLSLGTTTTDNQPAVALQAAVDLIEEMAAEQDRDVLIVAAAGNYGDCRPVWPAALRGVVAVGALTQQGQLADWSSRGTWVDCSVIADGVLTTYVEGREDPFFDTFPDEFGPNAFALQFGTSFAAPQLSGRVARVAQDENTSLRHALARVLAGARRIPDSGRVVEIQPPIG